MSIRPEQPEPFLRGSVFPAVTDAPYPRADPAGSEYLPADVWSAARLPVGVRLELVGNARTIRVWYQTSRVSLGYRGEGAGCAFVAYRAGQKVAAADAILGEGMVELVMKGRPDLPVTIYLPEGMAPLVAGVAGVEDTMVPAPLQPRWLAYGDAVTQGWLASAPALAWPAVAGRKLGLDVCNLGYAGMARGETTSALMLAETPAEVISIAFGLNNWSRIPHTPALMAEEVRCFLAVVRQGHPETPVVVISPTARPDAEHQRNRVGSTLAQLRTSMETTVRAGIEEGDEKLFLVEGLTVVDPADLEDGIYPGDEGHRRIAAAVSKLLVPQLADLQAAAEKRWAGEGISAVPIPVPVPIAYPDLAVAGESSFEASAVSDMAVSDMVVSDAALSDMALPETAAFDAAAIDGFDFDDDDQVEFGVDDGAEFGVDDGAHDGVEDRDDVGFDDGESDDAESDDAGPTAFSLSGGAGQNKETRGRTGSEVSERNGAVPELTLPKMASLNGANPGELAPMAASEATDDPEEADDPSAEATSLDLDLNLFGPPLEPAVLDGTAAESESDSASNNTSEARSRTKTSRKGNGKVPKRAAASAVAPAPLPEGTGVDSNRVNSTRAESTQVDSTRVDGAPVDGAQSNGSSPVSGDVKADAPSPEIKKPVPRDTAPVDIAVADMVVAALSLATNGADDVIYRRQPISEDDLHWVEVPDPTTR